VGTWHSPLLTQPAFALETLNTVLSFVGVTALHEIIASFGKSDDLSYAYLMCWGLFLGQCVEGGWNPPKRTADPSVLLSAYLWFVSDRPRTLTYRVRENYILHNPVRMTLSAIVSGLCKLRLLRQLYAKILRATDAKAMEAQHLTSAEDAKANKGRAQVMNLLTIDVTTVSSLATYLWNITNGLVRREPPKVNCC
jgi:hypothetical protein